MILREIPESTPVEEIEVFIQGFIKIELMIRYQKSSFAVPSIWPSLLILYVRVEIKMFKLRNK